MSGTGPVFGQDPAAAGWIAARLRGRWGRVAGVVPTGFAAYARLPHPEEEGNLPPGTLALLTEVLAGHTTTPEDCWFGLWAGHGWIHGGPAVAVLHLGGQDGPGEVPVPPAFPLDHLEPDRLVRLPGREYLVGRGPLEAAAGLGHQVTPDWFIPQSPNLLWPADEAWCVATEIDLDFTLVAGSEALVAELLDRRQLEAWPVRPDDFLQEPGDRDD